MKVGIRVHCSICGQEKKPIGRSAPVTLILCDEDCPGYSLNPLPGSLWPGETDADFGYSCSDNATKEIR